MLGYIREVLFPLASVSVFLPLKENVVRVERLDVRRSRVTNGRRTYVILPHGDCCELSHRSCGDIVASWVI